MLSCSNMDLLSHTLSGIAIGTLFATFSSSGFRKKARIVLLGGLGGMLPDFDAISLWSKFDSTIGAVLGLTHSGKEIYFGKFWYSHHRVLHSITAAIVLSMLIAVGLFLKKKYFSFRSIAVYFSKSKFFYFTFIGAFLVHLAEDMPTPASVWGGVNLFFPSEQYIGGYGKIWWWNNYDIFLIICSVIVMNIIVNILPSSIEKLKKAISLIVVVLGISLSTIQIMSRPVDFSYKGHTTTYNELEKRSKEIQREILGEKLYHFMEKLDRKIPMYF